MEAHMAGIISRLRSNGIDMGEKDAEYTGFFMGVDASDPSTYEIRDIKDKQRLAQFSLAAFAPPCEGYLKLQLKIPPVSRYDAWVKQGLALKYVKYWKIEDRHGNNVSVDCLSLQLIPDAMAGCRTLPGEAGSLWILHQEDDLGVLQVVYGLH